MTIRFWHIWVLSLVVAFIVLIYLTFYFSGIFLIFLILAIFSLVPLSCCACSSGGSAYLGRPINYAIGRYCLSRFIAVGRQSISNLLRLQIKPAQTSSPAEIYQDEKGYGLSLSTSFEWFILEKSDKFPLWKMVGVHESSATNDCVYLIGYDSYTKIPYILRCPPDYIKKSLRKCIAWNLGIRNNVKIKEV
ncbi:hypothetical protein LCGC14_1735980 [marine sediment metagenome]|uniref:Uncharacterized protein n=1 Tax=marine sediment metagenome TaxID=412755 RepID=A0A0F9K7S9_9ZZZZ